MPYNGSVLKRATDRLAVRRSARQADRDILRGEIYEKVPEAAELDRRLRGTAARIIRNALQEGSDPARAVEALRQENLVLHARQEAALAAAGYPPDVLDEKPLCGKCGDTGWRGAVMCDCLKALCAQEQIAELSRLLDLGEQSFERFDLGCYGDEVWPDWGRSPRDNMEKVRKICQDYAQNFGRYYFDNLFLSGATGLGKTFLSACVARVVSESGFSVVYDTAGNVFAQFETQKFSRDLDDSREARDGTRRYLGCDLLILDDLGSEMTTPMVQAALYQLINARLTTGRRTVISSNLTMDDVRRRYTPQIASRLEGEYRVLPFFGEDIRIRRRR